MGGSRDVPIVVAQDVPCWLQQAGASELKLFEQRGMSLTYKIFFLTDPGVTAQHQIILTRYQGQQVEFNPGTVLSSTRPDASAGLGMLWKVMIGEQTPEFVGS
jgi:hypothetical protein